MTSNKKTEKVLILHDIRSVLNVGAIFRTADAIGINKIYISGYTPSPVDRFGRERKDLAKSALGAQKDIEWEKVDDVFDLINTSLNFFFCFLICSLPLNSIIDTCAEPAPKLYINIVLVSLAKSI